MDGRREIRKQFQVPTLMLDATLPTLPVLQVYHPQVEIVADIKVAMPPYVHIRQVLGAPTSSSKLISSRYESERLRHLQAVQRYIIKRHIEIERTADAGDLPAEGRALAARRAAARHRDRALQRHRRHRRYTGGDGWRYWSGARRRGRGRQSGLAGVLTGRQPQLPRAWQRLHRLPAGAAQHPAADGSGHVIDRCDQHPDEFVEDVRWLICEAELVQALGRARAVNRDALSPLDVDILCDVVLPIVVDDVTQWRTPSELIVTASEGYMPTAPVDMMKLRPTCGQAGELRRDASQQGVPQLPGFVPVSYQLKGPKMKQRVAYFDLNIIPDPRAWLEQRLGPLVK